MNRIAGLICLVLATTAATRGQALDENNCPYAIRARVGFKKEPILHKYQTTTMPVKGWYAYLKAKENGVYWSDLASWQEQSIPGFAYQVGDLQISDDGEWLFYSYCAAADSGIGLVKRDGSGKVQMTVPGGANSIVSWYRNSPVGTEVAYFEPSTGTLWAIAVTLSSTGASFGQKRALITGLGVRGEIAVNGNHAFIRSTSENHTMYTIPDGGRGTTDAKSNRFTVAPPRNCGLTLSPDGSKGLSNQGRVACLDPYNPGIGTGLHKGFLVVPFIEANTPNIPGNFEEFAYNLAVSLNYAPAEYKDGRFPQQEFHHWYWSNADEWVIGIQQGSATKHKGAWLVNWPANEWFMLSPEGTGVVATQQPAVYLEPAIRISAPHRRQRLHADSSLAITASLDRLSGITAVEFFADGASIGTATAAPYAVTWSSHPVNDTVTIRAVAKAGATEVSSVEVPVVCLPRRAAPVPDSLVVFPRPYTIMAGLSTRVDIVCFDQYDEYVAVEPSNVSWEMPAEAGVLTAVPKTSVLSPAATFTAGPTGGTWNASFTASANGASRKADVAVTIKDFGTDWVRINLRAGPGDDAYDPTPSPAGWIDDYGYDYGLRESGLVYGFHINFPRGEIGRTMDPCTPQAGYPSIVYCTGALFTSTEVNIGDWEVAVPNATYLVKVIGDKKTRTDVPAWVIVEGVGMITTANFADAEGVFLDSGTVEVSDGRMTIRTGRKPAYMKLSAVEFKRVSDVGTAPVAGLAGQQPGTRILSSGGNSCLRVRFGRTRALAEVRDLHGRLLASAQGGLSETWVLPTKALGAGVYVLHVQEGSLRTTQRVVVR